MYKCVCVYDKRVLCKCGICLMQMALMNFSKYLLPMCSLFDRANRLQGREPSITPKNEWNLIQRKPAKHIKAHQSISKHGQ